MVLTVAAFAIGAILARAPAGSILRSSCYTLAAVLWSLLGAILSLISAEPANAVPMEVENLCTICNEFYTGRFPFCAYCGKSPNEHHGNCCLEKPAFLRRRTQQPKPKGRFPELQPQRGHPDWRPTPVPVKSRGRVVFAGDRNSLWSIGQFMV